MEVKLLRNIRSILGLDDGLHVYVEHVRVGARAVVALCLEELGHVVQGDDGRLVLHRDIYIIYNNIYSTDSDGC